MERKENISTAMKIRTLLSQVKQAYKFRHISEGFLPTLSFIHHCYVNGPEGDRECRFHLGDIRFTMRAEDWFALHDAVIGQEYSFISKVLGDEKAPVIADFGGNIGLFAVYAFSVYPGAKILSVEAGAGTFKLLDGNRAANPALDWKTLHAAVWKEDGAVQFNPGRQSTGSRVALSGGGRESIPAVSLRTLFSDRIKPPINLMKMDIEGSEESALAGNEELLKGVENIVIEMHTADCDCAAVAATLRRAYKYLYFIAGRSTSKPLVLATRRRFDFPEYDGDAKPGGAASDA